MSGEFYIEGRRADQDTQDLTIIRNKIADLHNEIADLQVSVSVIDTGVVTLKSISTSVQSDVTLIQGKVVNLQASVSAIDTGVVILESISTSVQSDVTLIQGKVTDLQMAVSEIDTLIIAIEATLTNVQVEVNSIQGKVTDLQMAVSAIDTRIIAIEATLTNVQVEVNSIHGKVTDLQASVTAVDIKISAIESSLAIVTSHIDFWSAQVPKITITSIASNPDFPWVEVTDLPQGAGVVRAIAMLKVRSIKDTSGTDNFLIPSTSIAVMLSGGSWGVNDTPAINLVAGQWHLMGGVKESGDVMIGDNDIKSVVSGIGTYLFRGDNIAALGNNLELYDVQIGLRVYFRKP